MAGGLSIFLMSGVWADVIPTSVWADFYGSASTYNGNPIPVGSVVDAYDIDGVHCGTDTVAIVGQYGFMPVYGNDSYGDGPEIGEAVTFYLNGRMVVPQGPDEPIWAGMGARREVNLSASAIVSMEAVILTTELTARPGDTIRYDAVIKNTGEGIDFYTISAVSEHGWIVKPMFGFAYALPGKTAGIYFDLLIPKAIFYDMDDEVIYRVASGIDPSVFIDVAATTLVRYITDVGEDDGRLLPGEFKLHQNYPNPFNPTTTIAFDLPVKTEAELEVFDLLGRRIEQINLGILNPGHHTFDFDGSSLASGIYLYRLKAGDHSDIKKMVLTK